MPHLAAQQWPAIGRWGKDRRVCNRRSAILLFEMLATWVRSPRYILVVDDDRAIRDALRLLLEEDGYRVKVARDGREALELLRSAPPPCVILLDLMMPEMDGKEFLRLKNRNPVLAEIPVCVMTASGRLTPMPAGVSAVLHKPFDASELAAQISPPESLDENDARDVVTRA
jgi:CheY-like chemotaxis protein